MKKITIIFTLLLSTFIMNAQKDTLYFDQAWKETSPKNAAFYRLIPLAKVGELYHLKDYYMNGNLQMEGFCIDPEKENFHGLATWYYEDGSRSEEINYQNGIKHGKATYYYEDELFKDEANHKGGVIREEANYKDGSKDGLVTCYYTNGVKSDEVLFVNGIKNGKATVYLANGIKSMEMTYEDGERIGESVFFYEDGTVVGTCIYKNYKPFEGVEGYTGRGYGRNQFEIYKEGKKISGYDLYEHTKQIAFEQFEDENRRTSKYVYYHKDGTKIGERTFNEEGRISDGPEVEFERGYNFGVKYLKRVQQNVKGKIEGEVISYDPNGKIISKGTYENNRPVKGSFYYHDGRQLNFYKAGKKVETISYDSNGEIIAKGTYKNGVEFNGEFYWDYDHSLSFYKDGKKLKNIKYEDNERKRIMYQAQYENGKINGIVRSVHYDKDESYECIYKDGKPFSGQFFEFYELTTYENGERIAYIKYEEGSGKIQLAETYHEDGSSAVQNFMDGEVPKELIYKDGKIYQGVFKDGNETTTFIEGKRQGPFTTSIGYPKIEITGNYLEDEIEGKVTYHNSGSGETFYCEFEKGFPMDGTVISEDKITNYKNGKKHGIETQTFFRERGIDSENLAHAEFDKITRTFNDGILDGDITYFLKEEKVGNGIYKNGTPFDGIFYDEKYKTVLNQGELLQQTYSVLNLLVEDFYQDGKLQKRVSKVEDSDKEFTSGTFLNGQPHEGTILTYDEGMTMADFMKYAQVGGFGYDKTYTKTHYKNGQKQGKETVFLPTPNGIIIETVYEKDIPVSKTTFGLDFMDENKVTGKYKNALPYDGQFFTKGKLFSTLSSYQDGEIQSDQFYLTSPEETILYATLNYKDGKPYQGEQLERYLFDCHQHFYENGQRIKTRIFPLANNHPKLESSHTTENFEIFILAALFYKLPGAEIMYTDTGFETEPIDGFPDAPYFKVDYTDETKLSGTASSNQFHSLIFEKGKVVNFEMFEPQEEDDYSSPQQYWGFDVENRLYQTAHHKDFFTQWIMGDPFSKKPDYKDFYYLIYSLNSTKYYYLKDGKSPFATFKINADGEMEGYDIEEDFNSDLYIYTKFENGEQYREDRGVTFPELLKIIKGE